MRCATSPTAGRSSRRRARTCPICRTHTRPPWPRRRSSAPTRCAPSSPNCASAKVTWLAQLPGRAGRRAKCAIERRSPRRPGYQRRSIGPAAQHGPAGAASPRVAAGQAQSARQSRHGRGTDARDELPEVQARRGRATGTAGRLPPHLHDDHDSESAAEDAATPGSRRSAVAAARRRWRGDLISSAAIAICSEHGRHAPDRRSRPNAGRARSCVTTRRECVPARQCRCNALTNG